MTIQEALQTFDLDLNQLNRAVIRSGDMEKAKENLEEIKGKVKKLFRRKAKALHPDLGNGTHEDMVKLSEAYEVIMQAEIIYRRPVRMVYVYQPYMYGTGFTTATATTNAGTTGSTARHWHFTNSV